MSKYDKDTKFYWLQLKEDFFEDDAIEWLEEQKPNGRDYAYFYLKLCLKSLKTNGILIRNVGNILIPYDNKKLAELTKIDFDTVTVAMELLKQIGLVQILENGEIYMSQLENLIGSISKGAFRKQQQIERRKDKENALGWKEGGIFSTKDKDKVKDKVKDINNYRIIYNSGFVPPTLEEIEQYCKERKNNVNPKAFYDYFTVSGWKDSKGNQVKNWKQKVITWEKYNNPPKNEYTFKCFEETNEREPLTQEEQEELKNMFKEFS